MSAGPSDLLAAMHAAGLAPVKSLDLAGDGRLMRYRVEGDKAGSRNGWVVFRDGQFPAGAFGSWRTGEQHTWRADRAESMSPADRAVMRRQVEVMHAARITEQVAVHREARERAAKLLARARPATDAHPYLLSRQVHSYGIRQLRDVLVIPARDAVGVVHTLQFISPDGTKKFLTGGRIVGCYYAIGKPSQSLLLCEGYATAATLHQATGRAVAACFNCGNLEPAAHALRAKFPGLRLIVCADNDNNTPGNPGVRHATAAARAVGGFVAVPNFASARP